MLGWMGSLISKGSLERDHHLPRWERGCKWNSLFKPAQWPSTLLNPVMFSTRKTWDLGHAPCLQELWKKDVSLDVSSVDFLMSDGEEETSFLPLQSSVFPRHCLTSDLTDSSAIGDQQLLIQTLQEKVSELQLQRLRQNHEQHLHDKALLIRSLQDVVHEQEAQLRRAEPTGARHWDASSRPGPAIQRLAESLSSAQEEKGQLQQELHGAQDRLHSREGEQQAHIARLHTQARCRPCH
ncbi:hypothetical protein AAFF_G00227270 [Aldrovandia affinis]|uniref:Uncharacterized protein n=1 Tax=Aldrovandia affinis TaxID=143900 RepID=A0AAD7X3E8_9TELE|nr:hypothetical protein AAFF_G00227270 [Aldrovandia affinis]